MIFTQGLVHMRVLRNWRPRMSMCSSVRLFGDREYLTEHATFARIIKGTEVKYSRIHVGRGSYVWDFVLA